MTKLRTKSNSYRRLRRSAPLLLLIGTVLLTACNSASPIIGYCPSHCEADACVEDWLVKPVGRPRCVHFWLDCLAKLQAEITANCPESLQIAPPPPLK